MHAQLNRPVVLMSEAGLLKACVCHTVMSGSCATQAHTLTPALASNERYFACMQDLLADSNPMVVANAVAALADIRETSTRNIFTLNTQSLQKLLRALNECTEWGQVQLPALLTISSRSSSRISNADAVVLCSACWC